MARPPHPKKSLLPTKVCPICGRPFVWRKKWARDWESVVYCSERCQREARRQRRRTTD
ncbi:MAG: DUF2256 domain-containing protein [Candidatus Thermofonsia Clade 3 bacterium]|jgi:hypothetical protein|uniref:DUF2256 domain-containing protein n=1 Tax=Candidatus Thermofonsia Clade 3 bacterium TaxID=2364212 RepID=A0A2M8QGT6_9CHLR|nr:DUF2256 domain-containing protein [Candidatus Roseilinea sp. NK_OTU-006]PJF49031.1 MAG: DUF2256 domain-containing protein [Candidatus Thermofonsia Clade 3 bacterium]